MKITIHIGPDPWITGRVQEVFTQKRAALASEGVLFAKTPGRTNHTRAFMAVVGYVDTLRFHRGYADDETQIKLRHEVTEALAQEVATQRPEHLVISAHQLGASLHTPDEVRRLRDMLTPLSLEINVLTYLEPAHEMVARHYAMQIIEGRSRSLIMEQKLCQADDWWAAAVATAPKSDPARGIFPEVQMAPPFVDHDGLIARWDGVFGQGTTQVRHADIAALSSERATNSVLADFGIDLRMGKITAAERPGLPPTQWLERARSYNDLVLRLLQSGEYTLPRPLLRRMLGEMAIGGPLLDVGHFWHVAERFGITCTPATTPALPEPGKGFRASQYLAANMPRIEAATAEAATQSAAPPAKTPDRPPAHLPPLAQQNYARLLTSPFAPHNRLGAVNEEDLAAPYAPAPKRQFPAGSTGRVIVACMKNEAPYIVEWVAYHRAIGVDNFLIYTNGCEDGTAEILDRLDALGIVEHRNNDDWKGKSPQQHALNQALKEPVVQNAEWLIHIDVDEFMNVRCGNGTLDDFFERVPGATNVAMTWRLFGHNGVTRLNERFVIDQFDSCAPKFCPKPHTVWGFKTMFRNIGAYEKMSCHRPNKLIEGRAQDVMWVNGSGAPMGDGVKTNGWRSSKGSIGYDLLQLNHYALRSAESFLIKRQRGRALHVDRSIGLNYWIRMDWSDFRDVTIKRNLPRLDAEYQRLMEDGELAQWHRKGLSWHRDKALELHGIPEFEELFQNAVALKLTETERVAYALSLDMET